jgi:hypothetical protein
MNYCHARKLAAAIETPHAAPFGEAGSMGERKLKVMTIPATMRALQQTSFNGPQDMRQITDAPVPVPGRGEVLIRVAADGVNFADISRAYGTFLGGPRPPYLAGFEAAGQIVAVGDAVIGPQPGARVVGVGDGGRDRPGGGYDGQALWRNSHRHRLAEQA